MIGEMSGLLAGSGGCCGPMEGWGWLGMTVGSLAIAGVVVLATWAWGRPSTTRSRAVSALEILEARYANGEISEEEYDEHRFVLED